MRNAPTMMAMHLQSSEKAAYRERGWVIPSSRLTEELIAPARAIAQELQRQKPWPDLLSGIHNPFGQHACTAQAWSFLDIGESAQLLDAIEGVLGPDIILWDSELYVGKAASPADEAQYWPVDPLSGTVSFVSLENGAIVIAAIDRLEASWGQLPLSSGPWYALRYMPAGSHFNRDPLFTPNRLAAEWRPLVNYTKRPIWLVRGEDRGGNDLAVGFAVPVPQWSNPTPAFQDRITW